MPVHRQDRRVKTDWRCAPVKAGTLFVIRTFELDGNDGAVIPAYAASPLDAYSHHSIAVTRLNRDVLFASLERVENPTPMQHLMYLEHERKTGELLDRLCVRWGVSNADLTAMCLEIEEESHAEYVARKKARGET
jgi:hypothetical protein